MKNTKRRATDRRIKASINHLTDELNNDFDLVQFQESEKAERIRAKLIKENQRRAAIQYN